ncbi:MAG: tRNA (N(6)-L-threonylcarbamoyladenosine(37)-C(2))-methylthiotransferase MtaB [bacterium]|nr:tRNA (N(6)-L-threonylcarbamoyladenosine(37)-C(2))-methylthiotransferase MtaB [bacterium]
MQTFKIYTYGCKTNRQESDYISQELKRIGFCEKNADEAADYAIFNSCSVTSNADDEVLYHIRRLKKSEPDTKIILTGCLAQADSQNLSANKDIYMLLGNSEKLKIADYILNNEVKCNVGNLMQKADFDEFNLHKSKRTRATLKIQDGCNSFCSYCIVPYTRGKSRSSKLENVIANINDYVNNGYKEIVLSAIHLGLWGLDLEPKMKFVDLLREVEKVEGLVRYRLGSLNPAELDDELMDFLISSEKVCNHLHVSLQSVNDKTLKNMNRHYTVAETIQKLDYLNKNIKELNIGADVIVGFPDETEEDFETTYNNIKSMPLSYMHIFPYSVRKYTKAAGMPNQVPEHIKKERAKRLKKLMDAKQNAFLNSLIGACQHVLIENAPDDAKIFKGVAGNYTKFVVESNKNISNNIVEVHAYEVRQKKLFAKVNN